MRYRYQNLNLIIRKLKLSDYKSFSSLFYSCFKKKISYEFFKWRYFNDRHSFCYGVFVSSQLIANVGMKSMYLNNGMSQMTFSRHSSMVKSRYRGLGIYSKLLNIVRNKISNKVKILIMWPNKNNYGSFGIKKNLIKHRKYYLYKIINKKKIYSKTENFNIESLGNFKNLIVQNNDFFFKDYDYFKKRYISYKKDDYYLNFFKFKNMISVYLIKKNKKKLGYDNVILDHFGSLKIKSKHFNQLKNEKTNLIFLSKRKINKLNYKFINHINIKIGLIKKINSLKVNNLIKKEFAMGDTDSFLSIE